MLTGMERLAATVQGRPADRIPVFCNLFDQGAQALDLSIEEYYSKGEYVAEAQLAMRARYGYDNVWNLFYVGKEVELLGCNEIIYPTNGSPTVGEYVIQSYDDIHALEIPTDLVNHPKFAECVKCMNILVDEVGGKQPIAAFCTSSMTLPTMLMGMEKWFDLLFSGPVEVRDELLTKCSDFFRAHLAYQIEAGADCIIYANSFASPETIPMEMIQDLSFKWMERDLAGFDRSKLTLYCGACRFNSVIDQAIERLGLTNFYLSPLADIAEGRQIVDGRGLVFGVLDDLKLLRWSHQEIRNDVRRILEAGMPGHRFAFGVQGMPYGIPEVSIRTMIDAAIEFGTYS